MLSRRKTAGVRSAPEVTHIGRDRDYAGEDVEPGIDWYGQAGSARWANILLIDAMREYAP
jgi:hypothetical protein